MKKITFAVLALAVAFIANAMADKAGPPRLYITAEKGKTANSVILLRGTKPQDAVIVFRTDITVDKFGNYVFDRQEGWKFSAFEWISLHRVLEMKKRDIDPLGNKLRPEIKLDLVTTPYREKTSLALKEKEETLLGVKVKVPYNVKAGEYYACVMVEPADFSEQTQKVGNKTLVMRKKTRTAIPVIITVPGGKPKITGKILSVGGDISEDEVKILATFENTGNVLEYGKGKALIVKSDTVYDEVEMIAMNASSETGVGEIFPDTIRNFVGTVSRPLMPGRYEIRMAINYGLRFNPARALGHLVINEEVAISQKERLVLAVNQKTIEFQGQAGRIFIGELQISNQGIQPVDVEVEVVSEAAVDWLEVFINGKVELSNDRPKRVRYRITIPRDRPRQKGQIVFTPKGHDGEPCGKPVVVDVGISGL